MDKDNGKEGEGRHIGDFLYSWKIFYNADQQAIMDRFIDWCKLRGYRHISGLNTLMDMAEWQQGLNTLAMSLADTNKAVGQLQVQVQAMENKANSVPKTLGCIK